MDAREAPEVKLPNVTLEMSELGVPREDVLQELFAVMDLEASAVLIPRDDVLESFHRSIFQHGVKDYGEHDPFPVVLLLLRRLLLVVQIAVLLRGCLA